MRDKVVSDVRKDQKAGDRDDINKETYFKSNKHDPRENRIDGHHKKELLTTNLS